MKVLIRFEKGEAARWLGHLDILRAIERALRRSRLPVVHSGGFNPRQKIAFASALGVGVTGAREPLIVELADDVTVSEVGERMNAALPHGLRVVEAEEVAPGDARAVLAAFNAADLLLECVCPLSTTSEAAANAAAHVLALPEIWVRREHGETVKSVEIRRFVLSLMCVGTDGRRATFRVGLRLGQDGSARPAELVAALAEALPGLALRHAHRLDVAHGGGP
jgi:radical SAM-linked protein